MQIAKYGCQSARGHVVTVVAWRSCPICLILLIAARRHGFQFSHVVSEEPIYRRDVGRLAYHAFSGDAKVNKRLLKRRDLIRVLDGIEDSPHAPVSSAMEGPEEPYREPCLFEARVESGEQFHTRVKVSFDDFDETLDRHLEKASMGSMWTMSRWRKHGSHEIQVSRRPIPSLPGRAQADGQSVGMAGADEVGRLASPRLPNGRGLVPAGLPALPARA